MKLRKLLQPTPGNIWPRMGLEFGIAAVALALAIVQLDTKPSTAMELLLLGGTLAIFGISMSFFMYEGIVHTRFFGRFPDVELPNERK